MGTFGNPNGGFVTGARPAMKSPDYATAPDQSG